METLSPSSLKKPRSPSGAWSIATRLRALYTISAFCILLLALAFMYWEISDDIHNQEYQSLVDEISTLRAIISEHPNQTDLLRAEVEVESTARPFTRYYARILDESDHVIMQTPGMNEVITSPDVFPPPLKVSESLRRGTK